MDGWAPHTVLLNRQAVHRADVRTSAVFIPIPIPIVLFVFFFFGIRFSISFAYFENG